MEVKKEAVQVENSTTKQSGVFPLILNELPQARAGLPRDVLRLAPRAPANRCSHLTP